MENKRIIEEMTPALLRWFQKNARELPWRQTREAYFIWVSEIMLQQTRVEAVKGYYQRFLQELPDIKALATVDEERLLKLWEGLGYYNRVRNMQKAAKLIMEQHHGKMPADYDEIKKLPGIGSYTAGAISSIAFALPYPAVDGNVLRVLSRTLGSYLDISKAATKKWAEQLLRDTMPKDCPGAFNQALMELGATLCGPNWQPRCTECPIESYCLAYKKKITSELPVKAPKKLRRIEEKTILLIFDGEKIALQRRPDTGLLAGLYEFPKLEGYVAGNHVLEYIRKLGLRPLRIQETENAKHIFTHVEWHMKAFLIAIDASLGAVLTHDKNHKQEMIFVDLVQLNERYPLPSAFAKYKAILQKI